jgi:hypothetical protein
MNPTKNELSVTEKAVVDYLQSISIEYRVIYKGFGGPDGFKDSDGKALAAKVAYQHALDFINSLESKQQ